MVTHITHKLFMTNVLLCMCVYVVCVQGSMVGVMELLLFMGTYQQCWMEPLMNLNTLIMTQWPLLGHLTRRQWQSLITLSTLTLVQSHSLSQQFMNQ